TRLRVSALTSGLPRSTRDTVACDTPARWAMSIEVALVFFLREGACIAAVCSAGGGDSMRGAKSGGQRTRREKRKGRWFPIGLSFVLARPEGFEPPTPKFVAWCSIQLSYGRRSGIMQVRSTHRQSNRCIRMDSQVAETEGFEPSMELLTPYSLSRGAP